MMTLRRIRNLYNEMVEADKDYFTDLVTNTRLKQEILYVPDIYKLTLITTEEHFSIIDKTSSIEKQKRLQRYVDTGLLKKRDEEDILPITYMEFIFKIWKEHIIDGKRQYLINRFPEFFI